MTKLTWDNAVLIGPKMARAAADQDQRRCRARAEREESHRPGLDSGRPSRQFRHRDSRLRPQARRPRRHRRWASTLIRCAPAAAPWFATGVQITQDRRHLQARLDAGLPDRWTRPMAAIVRWSAKPRSRNTARSPSSPRKKSQPPDLTLYKPYPYKEEAYAWGMAIDLNCLRGLQQLHASPASRKTTSPSWAKSRRAIGRHMHWIRVDAYYQGDRDNPKAYFQPVPCMQCENAPCEVVCPVGATNHSQRRPERHGLQPLRGHALLLEQLSLQGAALQLPALPGLGDAAIQDDAQSRRQRAQPRRDGKVHLLRAAHQRTPHRRRNRLGARRQRNQDQDGELQTACQQSCPAGAIIFGNINDPNSKVSKLKAQSRNYSLLGELNTRPRTTYLAEVSNPNPELKA